MATLGLGEQSKEFEIIKNLETERRSPLELEVRSLRRGALRLVC